MSVNSRFLPWVRQKSFAGDVLTVRASGRNVDVPVSRYGPGDVIGVAPAQIRRRDPAPQSLSMPPNLFPSVEFSQADLPWAFSPGVPDASGQLRPWLALITVEAPDGNPLGNVADAKLPVIEVPQDHLPSPVELALWAHVEVDAAAATTQDVIRSGIARILSPRALAPKRRYLACLVPTFEAGRLAGLGQPVPDPRSDAPSWTGAAGTVVLPVYDSWFFTTAESEDLETIARRLQPADLASTSRPKQLDVSSVVGNLAGKLAPFEGALRPVGTPPAWTGAAVAAAAKVLGAQLEHAPVGGVPVVGPPVYGSIASGQTKPVAGWLGDLNLDPRRRAAAGLGANMIRAHQEDLVDEAWRQAGDIHRARREHGGAQLAEFASTKLAARTIAPLVKSNALVTLAPALARMRDAATVTVAARVDSSVIPSRVLDPPFRRILATKVRPAKPSTPAFAAAAQVDPGIRGGLRVLNAVAIVRPGDFPPLANNAKTVSLLRNVLASGSWGLGSVFLPGETLAVPPRVPTPPAGAPAGLAATGAAAIPASLAAISVSGPPTPAQQAQFAAYAAAAAANRPVTKDVLTLRALDWPTPPATPPPARATARFAARTTLGNGAMLQDAIGVKATPRFTQPLAAWLDPAFLLSGIELANDAAGLLAVNSEFIEALIVGANHELARELLWRGVPLLRNSTLLGRFFESRMSQAPRDVTPIAGWKPEEPLGTHISLGERSVLILRSRLVSHLSETTIFLAKSEVDGPFRKPGATQLQPLFRGFVGLDTAYFGFEVPPEELAADPGWYFVIQELAGATRFGLDEQSPPKMTTWNDLAWPLVATAGGYLAVTAKTPVPAQPRGLVWGRDAAQMAAITLQLPIRISIHTSLLVPKKS